MKIENDLVTFDDADFSGLTPFAAQALSEYAGRGQTPAQFFSDEVNQHLERARSLRREQFIAENKDLIEKLAEDDAAAMAAKPLLDQLRDQLGVAVVTPPAPSPVVLASPQ